MICKVQRGRRNPPSMGSSVSEWLSYVSSVDEISQTTSGDISPPPTQPLLPRLKSENDGFSAFPRRRNKSISSANKFEHESEAIFGLPSFKVDMSTDHDQPIRVSVSSNNYSETWSTHAPSSPHIVECSLDSHFYDSLYVTMDVGLIFYLHEMIQAYMKENESAQARSSVEPTGMFFVFCLTSLRMRF